MQFHLSSTFLRSLDKLDKQWQGPAKQAALEFQLDPSNPGFKFHRIENAKDRHMWSFRVNRDIRIIVHHTRSNFTLCYVDHHQPAYDWAERHRLEEHPTTGAMQIIEVIERQEIITQQIYQQEMVTLPPLAQLEPDYLLRLGVPTEWVDWLLLASSDAILEQLESLPEAVQLRLMELLTGGTVEPPPPLPPDTEPMEHPDAARDFARIESPRTLEQALDAPWEEWLVFLHPSQRELVERDYNGPVRVFGSAGTGKSVVALHRAAHLARQDPDAQLLLTTFTNALTGDLLRRLRYLLGEDAPELERIKVTNIHKLAIHLYGKHLSKSFRSASSELVNELIADGLRLHPTRDFSAEYLRSEWDAVIEPYNVTTRAEYFDAPRKGRGRGLGKRQKAALWKVFEEVHAGLTSRGLSSFPAVCAELAAHFNEHPEERPFNHIIADEAQDLGHADLLFLRSLAPSEENDLFLVGDAGQRLYGRPTPWSYAGVDVRGRSFPLTTNYRTTEQIRLAAEALLPTTIESPDGEQEARDASSVRRGEEPTVRVCGSEAEEEAKLTAWLKAAVAEGYKLSDIGVFARRKSLLDRARRACSSAGLACTPVNKDDGSDAVRLSTMHSSKGLEFRVVAIIGCDSRTLPLASIIRAPADKGDLVSRIEAERNLLYVAATRARDRLFISCTGEPSKFLDLLLADAKAKLDQQPPVAPTEPSSVPTPTVAPLAATRFRLSPSRVAQYFRFNCPRFLRYNAAASQGQKAADGVPEKPAINPLDQAIFDRGFAWEYRVLEELLPPERVHIAPGDEPLHKRHFGIEQSLQMLRIAKPDDYLYQLTLRAPERFYERFDIDRSLVTWSDNRPDLIEVLEGADGERVFRVIDMKRGDKVRATHLIQLTLYALELAETLTEHSIEDARVDLEHGAVWLGDQPEPVLRNIRGVFPHLTQLLRDELDSILKVPKHEVGWHLNFRCEWCPYFEHCWSEMEATDDVSRLPRLTHRGKAFLKEHELHTVHDVHAFMQKDEDEADALFAECASLAVQRHQLGPRTEALNTGQVIPQGASARGLTLPTPKEVLVFLTIQRESLDHSKYLMGYRLLCAKAVPERVVYRHRDERANILLAESPSQVPHVRRQFVTELYGLLSRVDAFNLGQQQDDKLSVQFFVFSTAEQELLTELLFEAMEEPETARAAQTLLLYFQGPDLILAAQHPADTIPLPITVLLNVLGRVLALPIPVSYTLPEALDALEVTLDPPYSRDPEFHFPLGPALRSDLLYRGWHDGDEHVFARLRYHGDHFLCAAIKLFLTMRARVEESHLYSPKFELPLAARIEHPLLSRLAFFAQYESAISCTAIREERMIARRAVKYVESIHELEAIDAENFQVVGEDAYRLEPGNFANWLLVRDTWGGRRAQIQYNDFFYREEFKGGDSRFKDIAVVKIHDVEPDELGFVQAVTLKQVLKFGGPQPQPGERFLLYKRFSDNLTGRTESFLEQLDTCGPDSLFLRLLMHPETLAKPFGYPKELREQLTELTPTLGFTKSQEDAFRHICSERVLALWGPPGTGKTHYLATMILALMEAHRRAGKPFRVMVSAFTHAAVENLLKKLAALQNENSLLVEKLEMRKGSRWNNDDNPVPGIKLLRDKKKLEGWQAKRERCIIGGTVWFFDWNFGKVDFDLVVVDEASQVKVPEAAISVSMASDSGRVVFAGDHLQLPPIVQGTYPEPPEGEIPLHRSIFEAVCSLQEGHFQRQLQENFRMCDVLTSLSARLLYSERYRCANDEVATRRLQLSTQSLAEPCTSFLSPASPMVVGLLRDIPAGKDNEPEAQLVAELVYALRDVLLDKDGKPYDEDAEFFRHGVFIVSPHHSQIHRIRRCLQSPERRAWTTTPFVDTVDKMQGQEADVVIVSYGVSDSEFAVREAEFIYSLQRLNVSITRGKTKTILLLPEALLHAAPQVLEQDRAAQGLGYMRALVNIVRTEGESSHFSLPGGGSIELFATA